MLEISGINIVGPLTHKCKRILACGAKGRLLGSLQRRSFDRMQLSEHRKANYIHLDTRQLNFKGNFLTAALGFLSLLRMRNFYSAKKKFIVLG